MQAVGINYWAVLAAAVGAIVIGFIWYGPLFGKTWMQLMEVDKKKMDKNMQKKMTKSYVILVVTTLITSYTLAHFVKYLGTTFSDALQTAFWIWLGFVATIQIGIVLWEGKPWKLYLINAAHQLVNLAVMASILALWP